MKKILIFFLILAALALGAGSYWLYNTSDRTGPAIIFAEDSAQEEQLPVYYGRNEEMLLEGVSASDTKDGDVSPSLKVEGVFVRNENEVVVVYAAKDSSNNVTKRERTMRYPETHTEVIPGMADTDTQEPMTEEPGEETPAESASPAETPTPVPTETPEPTAEPTPQEAAAARELQKIDSLSPQAPRLYLTIYYMEIPSGTAFNRMDYVKDIQDDADAKDALYRVINIQGEVNINAPGTYELTYFVTDSNGNQSNHAVLTVVVQ